MREWHQTWESVETFRAFVANELAVKRPDLTVDELAEMVAVTVAAIPDSAEARTKFVDSYLAGSAFATGGWASTKGNRG